jgi:hypothetical protein
MNGRLRILGILASALLLGSCALFGTSKTERVMRLEADLNGNRAYAYQNFLESATTDYVTLATQSPVYTWDQWFPPANWPETTGYTFTVEAVTPDSVTATVTGPSNFGSAKTAVFGVVRAGIYWYLEKLTLAGTVEVD